MYYEINVSKGGVHFFATAEHSVTTTEELATVLAYFVEKFPLEGGFRISVSRRQVTGEYLSQAALSVLLAEHGHLVRMKGVYVPGE